MCEWLLSSEWCDVKLVCGGKTFNAHRAVLASASVFLRRVLLSCSQEDTPTFIVLPDFDLEAMSSVLYYVYNGEVFIDNSKLILFLDIVKTLDIFIDQQYLQKLSNCADDRYKRDKIKMSSHNEHESMNTEDKRVEVKRFQHLLGNSSLIDERCINRGDLHLSAPYLDRQRNSFLRDLYIETYPQNGNVNGVTGGVLAISNERYRAQTSVLLTNANGKRPIRADDSLSDMSRKVTENGFLANMSCKRNYVKGLSHDCDDIYGKSFLDIGQEASVNLSKNNALMDGNNYNLSIHYNKSLIHHHPIHSYGEVHKGETREKIPVASITQSLIETAMSNPYETINKYGDAIRIMQNNINSFHRNFHKEEKASLSNFTKVQIFNQVIDSPWRPRLPNNYKPFRRKSTHCTDIEPNKREIKLAVNDTNNNNVNNNNEEQMVKSNDQSLDDSSADATKFTCSICSQVFTTEDCLAAHIKHHATTTARYSCAECGKTFSQLRNYKYHVSVHRGTREFAATCTVCGKYFNDRGYLSSHMKIHRNRKEYKCSLCPKSFNQRVAYNMHVRIHTGVKPHVCEVCGKAFSRKMLLKQHQRTHSGERPYACPHCDKRFADRSNMTLHLRLHTGVKPFSCSLCPKSFTKKHHLKSHLNFHTGAKPYSCPRCKLAFTQSSNMRTHLKKCTAPPEDLTVSANQ